MITLEVIHQLSLGYNKIFKASLRKGLRFNKEPNFLRHGEAAPQKIGSLFSCMSLGITSLYIALFKQVAHRFISSPKAGK